MRLALPWVAVVALLLAGWAAWRVGVLTPDPEGNGPRPEPLSAAPAEPRPAPAPPSLAGPISPNADEEAWRRSIEARLEALGRRLDATAAGNETLAADVAEILRVRVAANELAALAMARQCIASQAQFQQAARCDEDEDGVGEYGGFLEMTGSADARMDRPLSRPVLHDAFGELNAHGEATRSGYLHRVFLPDASGTWLGETSDGFPRGRLSVDLAETTWCIYSWPVAYGRTGTRTWVTNQGGDILWTDAPAYSGSGAGPSPDAAYLPESRGRASGRLAMGATGADGNVWRVAE